MAFRRWIYFLPVYLYWIRRLLVTKTSKRLNTTPISSGRSFYSNQVHHRRNIERIFNFSLPKWFEISGFFLFCFVLQAVRLTLFWRGEFSLCNKPAEHTTYIHFLTSCDGAAGGKNILHYTFSTVPYFPLDQTTFHWTRVLSSFQVLVIGLLTSARHRVH